jgi:hypothetical protein
MKRVLMLACALSFAVASLAAQTKPAIATDADYSAHMKEVGSLNGGLNKAIQGGSADEAAKAAARLEVLFKDVQAYWEAKKVADATTAAQQAVAGAQAIAKAVAAKDMTAAGEARTKMGETCMACHKAHREKTETGFVIK